MSALVPPTLDPQAVARWHALAQHASPWLHDEVARRMEARLEWILREPRHWLHWEPLRGGWGAHELLRHRYPRAQAHTHVAQPAEREDVDERLRGRWWQPSRWRASAQVPKEGVDLLWANMGLHLEADPEALIRRWHDALAVDGLVMFACLGPDTLRELRALYEGLGWPPAGHEFTDMHDWGDMLVHAGFAEPVMDMERIELTFDSPERLLQELRELGRNFHPSRFPALRGREWKVRLMDKLRHLADPGEGGRLRLGFEIIYGHAFKPAPRLAVAPETRVSLDAMRDTLKRHRVDPAQ